MKLLSFSSTHLDANQSLEDIYGAISSTPDLIIVYMTVGMPMDTILESLSKKFPNTKLAGSTSCNGVMTNMGFHSIGLQGLGGMAFYSDSLDYGIGFAAVSEGEIDVQQACKQSLESANKLSILPSLIWMISSPGIEEQCIKKMKNYFGTFVPTFGGSAADNDLTGKWKLFFNGEIFSSGLIVISFFDIPTPHFSFHCGYQRTEFTGTVTKAEGRKIIEIDYRPAAKVYDEWTGGLLNQHLNEDKKSYPRNILNISSLQPLARRKGQVGSYPYFLLSHPETVTENLGMSLFTDIHQGEEVVLMEGSVESLQVRASEVAKSVLERERIKVEDIAGALVIFCAGCMLTVSAMSSMEPVVEGLKESLGASTPFLGVFSYGEQGCFFEESNFHGNLMISVTIFLKEHSA